MTRKKAVGFVAFGLALALSVTCMGCSSGNTTASSSSGSTSSSNGTDIATIEDKYVTADWLAENMDAVVIVDCRDAESFAASHIPGAVNLHWTTISNVAVQQGSDGWAEIASSDDIRTAAAALGIDGSKPVVLYTDQASGWGEDGRIYWELGEAGIDNLHILDGGWRQWVGKGGETVSTSSANEDNDSIEQVDTAYVKEHLSSAKIVDARTTEEYNAETNMGEAKMGRIPGAISVPYVDLVNQDSTLKSDDELKDIFSKAGLSTSDEIIVYCTGGVRAAAVAEILVDEGYTNVKVYTAGFSEWAGDASNEVEAEAPVPATTEG